MLTGSAAHRPHSQRVRLGLAQHCKGDPEGSALCHRQDSGGWGAEELQQQEKRGAVV